MSWDEQIRHRLQELRRAMLQLRLFSGFWRFVSLSAILFLLFSLLEAGFRFTPAVRVPVFWLLSATSLGLFAALLLLPLLRYWLKPTSAQELALLWGRSLAGVNDRLLNALQVYDARRQETTSPELAELALRQIAEELAEADFEGVLDRQQLRQARRQSLGLIGILVVAILVSQGALTDAFSRLVDPQRSFAPPPPFALTLEGITEFAIRGEPFAIQVQGSGDLPPGVSLSVRETNREAVEHFAEFDSSGMARDTLDSPQSDFQLYAHAGAVFSDTVEISVKSRPFIKNLQVRWFPPAYSRLPSAAALDNRGDVYALKGSRVRILLEADRRLQRADLHVFSEHEVAEPQHLDMQVDQREASQEFLLTESGHYNILLEDEDGIASAEPVDYGLWVIPDEAPSVEILYPPAEAELNESLVIPVKVRAQDDFSISRIRLGYSLVKGGGTDADTTNAFQWQELDVAAVGDGSFFSDFLWDLNSLNLLPGDEILYKAAAFDNDQVSGPKRAESSLHRLRFPTLEEIFARIDEGHSDQVETVQETLDRSKMLKEELDQLQEELKRNPDLSWDERKNIEDMLQRQEKMANQMQEMSQQLEQMIQKMEGSQIFSPETLQKYAQLQQMLSEIMTPELMQAMQKLQEALKQQDPEQLRRAVEEFALNQEEFLARMEKTLNILEQLKLEMKLDELAKRAEELLEKQEEINQALADSTKKSQSTEEAAAEKSLQRDMEAFEQEFQKTQELLQKSPFNPAETMTEAQNILSENQFPSAMNQMAQNLEQGENASAEQQGEKIQEGLSQLAEKMKQAKQRLTDTAKMQLAEELKRISHNLLQLSYQQESLLDVSQDLGIASPRFRSLAQEQQQLKTHLERTAAELFELSQKSFFITPQIGLAIDQAFKGMEQALSGYTARNPTSVSRPQQSAMGGLNRAVMEIGSSLDRLSGSSSSTGFSEMMEQLGQMAGQQGQINEGSMSLLPGGSNPGGFTLSQQAAMSRLAAAQEALRQQFESWYGGNEEAAKLLGRLGELGEEMRQISDELKNRNVDERTLKRQERILQRLLDAQRSVREREYRKERISKTAKKPYLKPSADDLNLDADQTQAELRELLLRALKEGYTKDYQQLVRAYFEALSREK
ncbi:MAG: DUF4175 family protein [bacterium]